MQLGHDHGYTSGTWLVCNMPVLARQTGEDPPSWETWMAISPHEIESQELGCFNAYDHTVVMGLGLGWFAINAALRLDFARVTVLAGVRLVHRP